MGKKRTFSEHSGGKRQIVCPLAINPEIDGMDGPALRPHCEQWF